MKKQASINIKMQAPTAQQHSYSEINFTSSKAIEKAVNTSYTDTLLFTNSSVTDCRVRIHNNIYDI